MQIALLAEPIWRAIEINDWPSIIGSSCIVAIAAAIVLLATRRRRDWARLWLAGLATLALLWFSGAFVFDFFMQSSIQWVPLAVVAANFVAVALLFTNSAEQWFSQRVG